MYKQRQPTTLLHPWDFPSKTTGVGCHFLLQRILPTQGSNLGLLHCRQTLYCLSHQGNSSNRGKKNENSSYVRERVYISFLVYSIYTLHQVGNKNQFLKLSLMHELKLNPIQIKLQRLKSNTSYIFSFFPIIQKK